MYNGSVDTDGVIHYNIYLKCNVTDTATVSVSLKQQLELLAESTKRSKSFCIVEAVRAYLETESWQFQAIRQY
ncbi:MAG: hypothetical protein GY795_43800 [Desulfobacterales bacterium]|nr:hypothetical protein [Desulfobacterales bacterium]